MARTKEELLVKQNTKKFLNLLKDSTAVEKIQFVLPDKQWKRQCSMHIEIEKLKKRI